MPTLVQYRRALQAALDDGGAYPVTTGSGAGATVQLLSDAITDASNARYNGAWVYHNALTQQRRIRLDGFTPSTGAFLTELGWTAPSPGDIIEITRLFPCGFGPLIAGGVPPEDTSYLAIINRSLARLWAPDRISVAFADAATASLTTWPWLDRPERLVRVFEPPAVAGFPDVPCEWRAPRLVLDGPTPVLQLNRPFIGTLTLEVRRPGDTLISGAESTAGLANDADTALPSVNDVVAVGLHEAYRALMNRAPGRPNPGWAAKYEAQQAIVNGLYYLDRTQMAPSAPPTATEAA